MFLTHPLAAGGMKRGGLHTFTDTTTLQDAELLAKRAEKGIVFCNETQISSIDKHLWLW